MEKDFDNWHLLKQKLDARINFKRPQKREIWWVSVGINVGSELYGKGVALRRPVLVINAENQERFIGIPLTSDKKSSKYSCIIEFFDEIEKTKKVNTALVSQLRVFDNRRLATRISTLDKDEFAKIASYFHKLLKIV